MPYPKAVAAIVMATTLACSGGDDPGATPEDSDLPDMQATSAADLPDPCALVTDEEISALLWQDMNSAQRDALQARNAQHTFTKRVENVDYPPSRTCYFQHRLAANDSLWSEGDFKVLTLARETFDMLAGDSPGSQEAIPGVGDQAFYVSNAAYARRGDVGVEVVEFGSRDVEIELLKNAASRLP